MNKMLAVSLLVVFGFWIGCSNSPDVDKEPSPPDQRPSNKEGVSSIPPPLSQVAGIWETALGFEGSELDISPSGNVIFTTSGCTYEKAFNRTATYTNEKLILSSNVECYGGGELRYFIRLKHKSREYLVPEHEVTEFNSEKLEFKGESYIGFRRRLPKDVLVELVLTLDEGRDREAALSEWSNWPHSKEDRSFLMRVLKDDDSPLVRRSAAIFSIYLGRDNLGKVTNKQTAISSLPLLKQAAIDDKNKDVREMALEMLGSNPIEGASTILWKVFNIEKDPDLKYLSAVALGQNGVVDDEVFDIIIAGLTDIRLYRMRFSNSSENPIASLIIARYKKVIPTLIRLAKIQINNDIDEVDTIQEILSNWGSPEATSALDAINDYLQQENSKKGK